MEPASKNNVFRTLLTDTLENWAGNSDAIIVLLDTIHGTTKYTFKPAVLVQSTSMVNSSPRKCTT